MLTRVDHMMICAPDLERGAFLREDWTMACGTVGIVADLMTGRMPDLDVEGLRS